MSLTFGDFESYKIITDFSDNTYTHTISYALGTSGPAGERVRVEKWSRVERVGGGGFGTVWKEKSQNGAVRAVKEIKKSRIMNTGELLALTKMNLYPNYFVQFLGWFQDNENIYLAMEYLQCGDLQSLIVERGGLPKEQIKSASIQLLEGLKIMHEQNFCHRDLKPQNVLIAKWFPLTVKIADFGTTKQVGDKTVLATFVGTLDFIAPEILGYLDADTSEYTNAVDVWSLGCLVYTMATQNPPFPGAMGLLGYIQGKSSFPGDKLESGIKRFISSLMMPLPSDRLTAGQALSDPWLEIDKGDTWDLWKGLPDTVASVEPVVNQGKNARSTMALVEPEQKQNSTVYSVEDEEALSEAAAHGRRGIVQVLLEKGTAVTLKDSNGNTALHRAVQRGHTDIVLLLLEGGADIMARGFGQATPLIMAAANGYKDLVQILIEQGTDITATDSSGHTVLHEAAQNGRTDLVRFLLKRGVEITTSAGDATPLTLAASEGYKGVVQLLLDYGVNIMERGTRGFTALHSAAQNGHIDVVRLLLNKGAVISSRTNRGSTPLLLAAAEGHKEVVRMLLDKGSHITERDPLGYTALHLTSEEGHTEVALLLLERGADTTTTDDEGFTALRRAAFSGQKEVVELLIAWDSDIIEQYFQPTIPNSLAGDEHIEVENIPNVTETLENESPIAVAVNSPVIGERVYTAQEDECEGSIGIAEVEGSMYVKACMGEGGEGLMVGEVDSITRDEEQPVIGGLGLGGEIATAMPHQLPTKKKQPFGKMFRRVRSCAIS